MGRRCACPGCRRSSGLHSFPADRDIRGQWVRALGMQDSEVPQKARVCSRHFSRDCFSNLVEKNLGFCKLARLKPDAVPCVDQQSELQLLLPETPLQTVSKRSREIGCQTKPTGTKHAFGQANVKPNRRSKATQARTRNISVSCSARIFMAVPEAPRTTSKKVKRTRCEASPDVSSDLLKGSDSTMKCTSTTHELSASTITKFILHPEDLMELFTKCPVCTWSCDVSKTVVGTLLRVKQSCDHCKYSHQWSSQPTSENTPAGNLG